MTGRQIAVDAYAFRKWAHDFTLPQLEDAFQRAMELCGAGADREVLTAKAQEILGVERQAEMVRVAEASGSHKDCGDALRKALRQRDLVQAEADGLRARVADLEDELARVTATKDRLLAAANHNHGVAERMTGERDAALAVASAAVAHYCRVTCPVDDHHEAVCVDLTATLEAAYRARPE